jgi:hypothetical protein
MQEIYLGSSMSLGIFKKELEGKAKAPVVIWYLPDSSDGWWFASRLEVALNIAGWNVERPIPIPARTKTICWCAICRALWSQEDSQAE